MKLTALGLALALLLTLTVASLASAAISPVDALQSADALITRVAAYTADVPDAAGAFEPWSGGRVEPGAPLLVNSYPALEPIYYYVRLTGDDGVMSFVTIGADDGAWHAYGSVETRAAQLVDRGEATAALATALTRPLTEDNIRIVSMPDKRLYWHAGTPGNGEAFVELADASNIHIGLDETISPPQPELPEPPPDAAGSSSTPAPESDTSDGGDRYPTSYDIVGVPHYYQVTSYNCGPAASEMVMDYWGEHIPQADVANVANCNPSWGSYSDDVRRTGHFSNTSTAIQNGSLQGYNERGLGYGGLDCWWSYPGTGDPDYPDRYDDLKNLVSSDYPVLMLTYYDGGHGGGHFRVLKAYDDNTNVFIVHDPWYSGAYSGPDLHFSQTFLVDNLWEYSDRWATLIAPWEVDIDAPHEVYSSTQFTVSATVTYRGPHPFNGQNSASSPTATIDTSPLFTLATGETATKPLFLSTSNTSSTVSWQLDASETLMGGLISVLARGLISDSSYSYSSYSDSIGGQASHPTFILDQTGIIVDQAGSGDFLTIQEGIDAADPGDTVLVLPGVYIGQQNRNLHFDGKAVTLRSTGGRDATIIDCLFAGRGFNLQSGETTTTIIEGFTLTHGLALGDTWPDNCGGGMLLVGTSPTISDMVLAYNQAPTSGGGIACIEYSEPEISDVVFLGNDTVTNGGGGVLAYSNSRPVMTDCLFKENTSDYYGGAVWAGSASPAWMERCTFIGNSTTNHGGAVVFSQESPGVMWDCSLYGNSGAITGGVYFNNSAALARNTIVAGSTSGAGVTCVNSSPTFQNCCSFGNAGGDYLCGDYVGNNNIFEDPRYCDAPGGDLTLEDCSPCIGGGITGDDIGAWGIGCTCTTDVPDHDLPSGVALYPASPSPFTDKTTLALDVPIDAGSIRLSVYSPGGRLVRTLLDGPTAPGRCLVTWNGCDEAERPVAAGVYFARCEWSAGTATRKLVLLR